MQPGKIEKESDHQLKIQQIEDPTVRSLVVEDVPKP